MEKTQKVKEIIKRLSKIYPNPKTALNFKNPLQLLIATILSAQTTDKTVNLVTPGLFNKYKTVYDFARAPLDEIDKLISKVNFHNNKSKSIKNCCIMIIDKFKAVVPDNIVDLDSLPGVARKTANVVLNGAFGKQEGIVVDTHVIRLARKLGLTSQKDPVKIEVDLMKIVPKDQWGNFPLMLILHGRDICTARPHKCIDCPLKDLCPDKN
jgi:endonuclease-3